MRMVWMVFVLLLLGCGHESASTPSATMDAGSAADGGDALDGEVQLGSDAAADSGSMGVADGGAADSQDTIDTPVDTWTFLPVAGTACANGTQAGIGVNRSDQSTDILLTLQGGGACWDANTCFTIKSAVHIADTYDAALFQSDFVAQSGPIKRDPQNPLSLATTVFIPYCTGDLHAGDAVRTYDEAGTLRTVHHVGARNIDAILARLQAGLPTPQRVWVIGSSAGGYGAQLELLQIAHAFPSAQVHMLADCAPLLTPPDGRYTTWQSVWNMRLPDGCSECKTRFGAVIDAIADDDPTRRIGLLAFDQDGTIGQYFGFDGTNEAAALTDLLDASYGHANTRYFVAPGTQHVMLGGGTTPAAMDGTTLDTWLASWLLGLPTWQNAR